MSAETISNTRYGHADNADCLPNTQQGQHRTARRSPRVGGGRGPAVRISRTTESSNAAARLGPSAKVPTSGRNGRAILSVRRQRCDSRTQPVVGLMRRPAMAGADTSGRAGSVSNSLHSVVDQRNSQPQPPPGGTRPDYFKPECTVRRFEGEASNWRRTVKANRSPATTTDKRR